jgi:hypothetical protein
MNLKHAMALACAAALALPALAQQAGSTTEPQDSNPAAPASDAAASAAAGATGGFSAMDRNADGYVSRDEAREVRWSDRFGELDRDNDGRLSEAEYNTLSADSAAAGATTSEEKK